MSSSLQSCSSCRVFKKGSTNFSSSVVTVADNGSARSHFILHFCATNVCPTLQEISHCTCKTWAEKSLPPFCPIIVRKICCLTREKFPLLIDSQVCLADYNSPTYPYVIHTHTSALASAYNCYSIQTAQYLFKQGCSCAFLLFLVSLKRVNRSRYITLYVCVCVRE